MRTNVQKGGGFFAPFLAQDNASAAWLADRFGDCTASAFAISQLTGPNGGCTASAFAISQLTGPNANLHKCKQLPIKSLSFPCLVCLELPTAMAYFCYSPVHPS